MKIPSALLRVVAFLILCSAISGAQTYTVTDLGTIGGNLSYASAVNDSGQVVGSSYITKQNAIYHAFIWTAATGLQDLGTLGGNNSYALAINNAGQVVGCADVSPSIFIPGHAFLWTQATGMQDLGTLGGGSCALGINDAGQVVGLSTVSTNVDNHAFIWSAPTGMQDLGVPVSSNTFAASINNSGTVVGTYYSSTGGNHAFLWTQSGGVQDLGNLGIQEASAGGINDFGEAVGSSEVLPGSADLYAGFRWTTSGGLKRLPSPYPKSDATASAVSATGEIVGFALNSKIQQRATVWLTPSNVHDLNSLTVNSPMILVMAKGVNNVGQLVGVGRNKTNAALAHAFLATPTGK
jgi:probable HAF family extracellular repeat protein